MSFTRNFLNLNRTHNIGSNTSHSYDPVDEETYFNDKYYQYYKNVKGDVYKMEYSYYQYSNKFYTKGNLYNSTATLVTSSNYTTNVTSEIVIGIGFGKSNTEETLNDYILDFIDATYNSSKNSIIIDEVGNVSINYSIVATSNEDATIKEVGIFKPFNYNSGYEYGTYTLIYRKVLDTPIQVKAGQVFTFSCSIEIPNTIS